MARAIWMALAFATLASGARYVDYSGVKMPEYGSGIDYDEKPRDLLPAPADDYHAHDASANLDYKYEEDLVKTVKPKGPDSEDWQKPVKTQRKSLDDPNLENIYKYSSEEIVPKFKANNRLSKHRQSRIKHRISERDDVIAKRPIRHGRSRKDDNMSDVDRSIDRNVDEFQEDDDEKFNYNHRATTLRTIRRKPRDRLMPSGSDVEEDTLRDTNLKTRMNDRDFRSDDFQDKVALRRTQTRVGGDSMDDTDMELELRGGKSKPNKFNDYFDYYDMKRVQGIKEKLPALIRRTSTTQRADDERANRRMMAPIPEHDYYVQAVGSEVESDNDTSNLTTTTSSITTTTAFPEQTETSPLVIRTRYTHAADKPKNVTLSYAEKSRLSILKKAQRKEMIKGDTTLKPPVLIQVTDKVHTMVIIEPPTSEMPWKRAREVSDDTPEQLKKVKRMMRHKLVNNAKDIHDLTENWDDMVCDYIDTSLLSNHVGKLSPKFQNVLFCVCVITLISNS